MSHAATNYISFLNCLYIVGFLCRLLFDINWFILEYITNCIDKCLQILICSVKLFASIFLSLFNVFVLSVFLYHFGEWRWICYAELSDRRWFCDLAATVWYTIIIIRLEARLRPNIGFTLRDDWAVFTCSAIAESEPLWMKSGALWVHCWGLALTDFECDPRSSDSL